LFITDTDHGRVPHLFDGLSVNFSNFELGKTGVING